MIQADKEVSAVIEEYLENIYRLQETSGVARTSEIVKLLQVVPGTVTNMVERLEREGFVTHTPYKGVALTEKGRKIAINVIRRHRLSERLLTDILQVKWSEAHELACKLEHSFTGDLVKKLEKALKHPETCPHGNPIPTQCGGIIEEKSVPLTNLKPKEKGVLVKITNEKHDVLEYLNALGLMPKALLEVVEKAPFNGPITVKINGTKKALSFEMASIIYVKKRRSRGP
jgi:DtxR family Mn-dependent transcriptional regulator